MLLDERVTSLVEETQPHQFIFDIQKFSNDDELKVLQGEEERRRLLYFLVGRLEWNERR